MPGLQYNDLVAAQTTNAPVYGQQGQVLNPQSNIIPVSTPALPTSVSVDTLSSPETPLNVPSPNYDLTSANGLMAGAENYSKLLTPTDASYTADKAKENSLNTMIEDLLGKQAGKGTEQLALEQQAGIPDKNKQLADLQGQIQVGNAEYKQLQEAYNKVSVDNRGKAISMSSIIGNEAQINYARNSELNTKAADVNLSVARAQYLQGNLTAAQNTVNRALDLKYSVYESELKLREYQLNAIKDSLNKEETKRANALQLALVDEKRRVEEEKTKSKENLNLALESGVTSRFANRNGEIYDVNSGKSYSDAATFLKDAGVTSFEEAYAKGLVQDIKNTKLTFVNDTINGQAVRFGFDETGKMVSKVVLGKATTKTGTGTGTKPTLKDDVKSMQSEISTVTGADGYISPENWKVALKNWQDAGYSAASFKTNFQNYINPADPADYK